jgi:hypothetical protein
MVVVDNLWACTSEERDMAIRAALDVCDVVFVSAIPYADGGTNEAASAILRRLADRYPDADPDLLPFVLGDAAIVEDVVSALPHSIHVEGWSTRDDRLYEYVMDSEDAGRILWWRIAEHEIVPCARVVDSPSIRGIGWTVMRWSRNRRMRMLCGGGVRKGPNDDE